MHGVQMYIDRSSRSGEDWVNKVLKPSDEDASDNSSKEGDSNDIDELSTTLHSSLLEGNDIDNDHKEDTNQALNRSVYLSIDNIARVPEITDALSNVPYVLHTLDNNHSHQHLEKHSVPDTPLPCLLSTCSNISTFDVSSGYAASHILSVESSSSSSFSDEHISNRAIGPLSEMLNRLPVPSMFTPRCLFRLSPKQHLNNINIPPQEMHSFSAASASASASFTPSYTSSSPLFSFLTALRPPDMSAHNHFKSFPAFLTGGGGSSQTMHISSATTPNSSLPTPLGSSLQPPAKQNLPAPTKSQLASKKRPRKRTKRKEPASSGTTTTPTSSSAAAVTSSSRKKKKARTEKGEVDEDDLKARREKDNRPRFDLHAIIKCKWVGCEFQGSMEEVFKHHVIHSKGAPWKLVCSLCQSVVPADKKHNARKHVKEHTPEIWEKVTAARQVTTAPDFAQKTITDQTQLLRKSVELGDVFTAIGGRHTWFSLLKWQSIQ